MTMRASSPHNEKTRHAAARTGQRPRSPRLFSEIPDHDVHIIMAAARLRHAAAGQIFVRRGEPAAQLFLMTSGGATYTRLARNGDEVVLELLAPGDVFGIGAFLPQQSKYVCTVQAVRDCEMLAWNHSEIRRLARTYPQLIDNLLRIGTHRASAWATRIVAMVSETAADRVARTLVDLGRRSGQLQRHGLDIAVTNEQLSALADVSPFTTSRLLAKWRRAGAILKQRGSVTIRHPEALHIQ
jgi:CRP-like cAMP-binding protein